MLTLRNKPKRVEWPEADVWLDLVPLTEDVDQQIAELTTEIERDGDTGRITRLKRDSAQYAVLVGKHCIKDWGGVVDEAGSSAPCDEDNIARFMRIGPAQDFVISKVKSLELHLQEDLDAAKKD